MTQILIKPFNQDVAAVLIAHFDRHKRESGVDGNYFMPFAPNDPEGPKGISVASARLPLSEPGWQRWFYAEDEATGRIIGHVNLKQDGLRAALHRCELGIGIEAAYRGAGLGRQLMLTAIEFARAEPGLQWIDIRVFASNTRARRLYQSLGFVEIGEVKDRFRIDGVSISDVLMVLDLSS